MSNADLQNPVFTDETAARKAFEEQRWPDGPVCPHCGGFEKIGPVASKNHKPGFYYCGDCKGQFTVTVGTIFEKSKIPLSKWWLASHLMGSSKKGISAHQLHRSLGVTYKTAWFMAHRIREAMREIKPEPMGGEGKWVEADETYIGGLEKNKHAKKRLHRGTGGVGKEAVYSLVERGGSVRSHHVPTVSAKTLRPILVSMVHRSSTLMTDENPLTIGMGREFARHESVGHKAGEYVRGEAHTNTIEGYFSILQRGIVGTYHHVSPQHLKRYLGEFDFRYNERMALGVNDAERTKKIMKGAEGKRLTYQQTGREGQPV